MDDKHVLVLRTSDANRRSYGGFEWPASGPVECPDWDPQPHCGNGLHGALWGEGDGRLLDWSPEATWQVIKVLKSDIVDLGGKVKYPRGEVIYSGDRKTATDMIYQAHPGSIVIGGAVTLGDRCTAKVGDKGTATVGDYGTAQADYGGTATAGDYGTAQAGDFSTAQAGYRGTAQAGYGGTARAGDWGTAKVGEYGTAQAGYRGTARAGDCGTARAGEGGTVVITYYDGTRQRTLVGHVGEDGIKADIAYRGSRGKFLEAK